MYEAELALNSKEAFDRLKNLALSRQRTLMDIEKLKEKELQDKLIARNLYVTSMSKLLFQIDLAIDGQEESCINGMISVDHVTVPLQLEV